MSSATSKTESKREKEKQVPRSLNSGSSVAYPESEISLSSRRQNEEFIPFLVLSFVRSFVCSFIGAVTRRNRSVGFLCPAAISMDETTRERGEMPGELSGEFESESEFPPSIQSILIHASTCALSKRI